MLTKEHISDWFLSLQDNICNELQKEDGDGRFEEDIWKRDEGGGGRTRIMRNGKVIEKGGVLYSAVYGEVPLFLKKETNHSAKSDLQATQFYATGVSIVIHPLSPMVPIIHMNVRYFEMDSGVWWFGGGIDLTPHYINKDDAHYFHTSLRVACDKHNSNYYSAFKKEADNYFYIPHRNETRGIGGVFFDRLIESENATKEQLFDFVKEIGNTFAPVYTQLMNRNKNKPFSDENKQWQLIRRGRYVEFNLVYDKGTKFGLETNGRTESILMSLPRMVSWEYNHIPKPNSEEEKTISFLKKGIDW